MTEVEVAEQIFLIETDLALQLLDLNLQTQDPKVSHIYNPLDYAKQPHQAFLRTYMNSSKKILFLGMNPGPFGMAQTGVPFGEVQMVKSWLKISGEVTKPEKEHPKRPVLGMACPRREESGKRFWELFQHLCGTPDKFFESCAVYNHCPLLFLASSGKNLTPVDLRVAQRNLLLDLCDEALVKILRVLQVQHVVGIGRLAEERVNKVIRQHELPNIQVHYLNHPSPASATANQLGWPTLARQQLEDSNLMQYLTQ